MKWTLVFGTGIKVVFDICQVRLVTLAQENPCAGKARIPKTYLRMGGEPLATHFQISFRSADGRDNQHDAQREPMDEWIGGSRLHFLHSSQATKANAHVAGDPSPIHRNSVDQTDAGVRRVLGDRSQCTA